MMDRIRTPAGVMPFETNRSVANATNNAAVNARYWSTRMAAVSVQHDRTSFMRIYDRRTVLGLGVPDNMAEEPPQEALPRLWRKAGLFDPQRASLSTWLFRIARNLQQPAHRSRPARAPLAADPGRSGLARPPVSGSAALTTRSTDQP
ncbi:MAG: sigma factor [Rhodanobacter sp.]|jgi:RNA polymerase sigma-70 factor (ECF subfamily)